MKTNISGSVIIPKNDKNASTGFLNLSVKVYQVTLNTAFYQLYRLMKPGSLIRLISDRK